MKALLLERPAPATEHPLVRRDLADPMPGAGELLLRVVACGVCRTDLQIAEGDLAARRLPIVLGHQVVGVIEALGSGVADRSVGERAGVTWLAGACGTCRACASGLENLCHDARFTGWDRDGGFAERMTVRADFALRLPESLGDIDAAPLLCGGVVGYRALRIAGIDPDSGGRRLGLYGFGSSAVLCLQVAVAWGVDVHVATRSGRERERALELGASSVGGYDDVPPQPLDAAISFAPVGQVAVAALRAVDRGAPVVINAIHLDGIPAFSYELLWWERSLRSVANVTRRDATEFMDVAAAIGIRAQAQDFGLDDANEALEGLARGALAATAVLRP
ncbi:MAG TPA: zinc-dependent alcohol dehydrogenase family protein [Candidatus Limnocylindrales bacterium]|nr:zinc-dependent alcohol dehydrogenase family protein [Candidatus Limnocylindrales bacterium]